MSKTYTSRANYTRGTRGRSRGRLGEHNNLHINTVSPGQAGVGGNPNANRGGMSYRRGVGRGGPTNRGRGGTIAMSAHPSDQSTQSTGGQPPTESEKVQRYITLSDIYVTVYIITSVINCDMQSFWVFFHHRHTSLYHSSHLGIEVLQLACTRYLYLRIYAPGYICILYTVYAS